MKVVMTVTKTRTPSIPPTIKATEAAPIFNQIV